MKINSITVFCGASIGSHKIYQEKAEELGAFLGEHNITLIYGGGKVGLMGAVADEVLKSGGKAIGIIPELLHKEEIVHPNINEVVVPKTMSERKVLMSKKTDAYVILPGGMGTLDELFEALTLQQLKIEQKPIGLLNVNGFYDATLQQLNVMIAEGFLKLSGKDLLLVADSVEGLMKKITDFKMSTQTTEINKIV